MPTYGGKPLKHQLQSCFFRVAAVTEEDPDEVILHPSSLIFIIPLNATMASIAEGYCFDRLSILTLDMRHELTLLREFTSLFVPTLKQLCLDGICEPDLSCLTSIPFLGLVEFIVDFVSSEGKNLEALLYMSQRPSLLLMEWNGKTKFPGWTSLQRENVSVYQRTSLHYPSRGNSFPLSRY